MSAAFEIGPTPKGAKHDATKTVKRVLELIDSVHADGVLPKIQIQQNEVDGQHGEYRHASGKAKHISVNPRGDHGLLTLTHEIGHFLDHQGISEMLGMGAGKFGSEAKHKAFKKFRIAVKKSEAYRTLRKRMKKAQKKGSKNARYYEYLTRPREIFARAYAQWIATKTDDAEMRAMLDKERVRKKGVKYNPRQWDDEDFKPVAKAFDHLFGELGWLPKGEKRAKTKSESLRAELAALLAEPTTMTTTSPTWLLLPSVH